jgi:TPR repeat protein
VVKDLEKAVSFFRQSAEKGYSLAQLNLAVALMRGIGTRNDTVEAYKWMLVAKAAGERVPASFENEVSIALALTEQTRGQEDARLWLSQHYAVVEGAI